MTERGHFFAVDRRTLEEICERGDGLDTATAYLVLARFAAGRNHSSTRAGMTALSHEARALPRPGGCSAQVPRERGADLAAEPKRDAQAAVLGGDPGRSRRDVR